MTELLPLTDPYASVRVAVYEPFVTTWISVPGLEEVLVTILQRRIEARSGDVAGGKLAPSSLRFNWRPEAAAVAEAAPRAGQPVVAAVAAGARALVLANAETARRSELLAKLRFGHGVSIDEIVQQLDAAGLPHLMQAAGVRSLLSPIGVTHLYRQLYFDAGAGIGPIEHAFTLAPLEQMEVIQEVTRRETAERIEMFGSESTLEKESEDTATDEISDQVQTAMRRDLQASVSASASGSIGVWSTSAEASLDLARSSERARETATTRSTTQTRKASETLRKTYSLTVKTFTELNERSSVKRVIRNDTAVPVNYGLRRVMRTIRVKLQSLGPRLVWQTYVRTPGARLALSKMVMFRDADPLAPGTAPTAPPRPTGGSETGSQQVRARWEGEVLTGRRIFVLVVIQDPLRAYTSVTITSITDTAPPEEDPNPPCVVSPTSTGTPVLDANGDIVAVHYTFELAGDGQVLEVEYALSYQPSTVALSIWTDQVRTAQSAWDAQRADEAIERARRAITAKSRIRPRPPGDLRDEERYELTNRFITSSFGNLAAGAPSPVEIELFHRYFDVSALFYWVHPSWWQPRAGIGRDEYEVTEDSEPAPFGRSLGWLIQLDGDRRRNEFLNSPWVRVCTPIRPGRENDALDSSADAYPIIDEFNVTVPTEGFIYDSLTTAP